MTYEMWSIKNIKIRKLCIAFVKISFIILILIVLFKFFNLLGTDKHNVFYIQVCFVHIPYTIEVEINENERKLKRSDMKVFIKIQTFGKQLFLFIFNSIQFSKEVCCWNKLSKSSKFSSVEDLPEENNQFVEKFWRFCCLWILKTIMD